MIDDISAKFKSESKKYSKENYRPVIRTLDFKIYYFSTLMFIPSFLYTYYNFFYVNSILSTIIGTVISCSLIVISIFFEKRSNKDFFCYQRKKDRYLKKYLMGYLAAEYSITESEQYRQLSDILVKKIGLKKSYYNFNPAYVSIILTTLLGISKAAKVEDYSVLVLVVFTILAFTILHLVLKSYTSFQNLPLNTFEEIDRLVNEILLEKPPQKKVSQRKIRGIR